LPYFFRAYPHQAKDVGGVFHCYSGSVEMLKDVLENNFYISVAEH